MFQARLTVRILLFQVIGDTASSAQERNRSAADQPGRTPPLPGTQGR